MAVAIEERTKIQLHFWIKDNQALQYGIRQGHHVIDIDADILGNLKNKITTCFDYHENEYHHFVTNDCLIPIIKSSNPTEDVKKVLENV